VNNTPITYAAAAAAAADTDTRPPPIIYHGPQNQTLPVGNPGMLPCLVGGEPMPSILWLKGNAALTTLDPRITVLESGTLEIKGTEPVVG
jgi:hypothetical protein